MGFMKKFAAKTTNPASALESLTIQKWNEQRVRPEYSHASSNSGKGCAADITCYCGCWKLNLKDEDEDDSACGVAGVGVW